MTILRPLVVCIYRSLRLLPIRKKETWIASQLVPDILDKPPEETLTVTYPKVAVTEGAVVRPMSTKYKPKVSWNVRETGNFYTLLMSDVDAPSRQKPTLREWHHWLVGNIPDNNLDKGQVLTEYIGAGPPKGTGLHRKLIMKHNLKLYGGLFFESEYDEFVSELHKQIELDEYHEITKQKF